MAVAENTRRYSRAGASETKPDLELFEGEVRTFFSRNVDCALGRALAGAMMALLAYMKHDTRHNP